MRRLNRITQKELDTGLKQPLNVLPPGTGGNLAPTSLKKSGAT